jgi:dipeptidase E
LNQYRETGFDQWLKDNISAKVYVGVSAGTIVATPSIDVADIEPRDQNISGIKDTSGLSFIAVEVEPHCTGARFEVIEQYAQARPNPVYAIDDQTALKCQNGTIEVVSEGSWKKYE